jgi:SAM-dependent methyltransferase
MASAEVQRSWTGSDGANLLAQTNTFVRMVSENFASISGRSLSGKRILDFGCGYGRILRSMLYFSDPADLYGCDPWDRSIDLCKQDGLTVNLALSEYLPTQLPFTGRFDLIYPFSVFTHLSLRATRQCLDTLHGCIGEMGFWLLPSVRSNIGQRTRMPSQAEREQLVLEHNQDGFAFRPHERAAVDGEITYGDTSMTIPYLAENFDRLEIAKVEHFPADPYQIIIFLRSKR